MRVHKHYLTATELRAKADALDKLTLTCQSRLTPAVTQACVHMQRAASLMRAQALAWENPPEPHDSAEQQLELPF